MISIGNCFVDTTPLSQDLIFVPFSSKSLKDSTIEIPLDVLNLFLESDGYIEIFVKVKLKARIMHCFLSLAYQMFDYKRPI